MLEEAITLLIVDAGRYFSFEQKDVDWLSEYSLALAQEIKSININCVYPHD